MLGILRLLLLLFLFRTIAPAFVVGYKIDQSCEDKGITADIRDAMTSAFEMVSAAYTTLTSPTMSADALELVGFLFAREGADPAQLLQQGRLGKTIELLQNIQIHMEEEVTGDTPVSPKDVIIFCHYDRWVPVGGKENLWEDTTNGVKLRFREQQCRGGTAVDKVALAVTANMVKEVTLEGGVELSRRQPTQIQLCLWFADWIKQKEHKTAGDVKRRTRIGRYLIEKAESNGWTLGLGLSQIDAFSLLDKVLLHEMTHARGAFEGSYKGEPIEGLKDVPSPNGLLSLFQWGAYGWKGAIQIARKGDDLGGKNAADNNADTIALFGSGCKLLRDPNPRKIDSKGRIVPTS